MSNLCRSVVFAWGLLFNILPVNANASGYLISGEVVDSKTRQALPGAVIGLRDTYLWAVSDQNGRFSIGGIQPGDYTLQVSLLGYVDASHALSLYGDRDDITVALTEKTLAIEGVTVTAQADRSSLNTTRVIGSSALEHLQLSGVTDIMALLPGGKMNNPDLMTERFFSLRDGGSTAGNARFGTAVEVDGVRVGNNASFGELSGVGTRNIAVTNIESVEVMTGVPSAEYGDLNSGIVKIHTRRGQSPTEVQLSVNPRTRQASFSKGVDLGGDRGVVNVSGEWTRATQKLTSPYTSYTRRGLSVAYANTFRRVLKFNFGVTGNLGGMNSEKDPDTFSEEYTRVRDNALRANTSLTWLLNRSWITNLTLDASLNYNDNRQHEHTYHSSASEQPAVHATQEGYFVADKLPFTYFADRIVDSKQLDYGASLKYEWTRRWGEVKSDLKAGLQWRATGNAGEGEYYLDPSLAPNGYRPRPYSSYPYMHNVALYAEEKVSLPVGGTTLQLMAGMRFERLAIRGTEYDGLHAWSPRLNARWRLSDRFSVRGGWGVTRKLPSYYTLFPAQEYRDIQTFGFSYGGDKSTYIYYTRPHTLLYNADLRWQRNHNAELGVDMRLGGVNVSLVGYSDRTQLPYKQMKTYTPYEFNYLRLPAGYTMPADPQIRLDNQTGMLYVRGGDGESWTAMDAVSTRTFVASNYADNGADVTRRGAELVADFPEIKPLRTRIRFDAAYGYTYYVDSSLSWYFQSNQSDAAYVGIYATGGGTGVANGKRTHTLDANLTAVTHITEARLIISCRLEMSFVRRSQNLSVYDGKEYAYNVAQDSNTPVGGSIYGGGSYTAIRPVAYVDLDGQVHPFTDADAENPALASLILKSNNAYTFSWDSYDPYFSAHLNVTKEIGNHVSLSFFANNFTNATRYVTSRTTGIGAPLIPEFYYGFTCRAKF